MESGPLALQCPGPYRIEVGGRGGEEQSKLRTVWGGTMGHSILLVGSDPTQVFPGLIPDSGHQAPSDLPWVLGWRQLEGAVVMARSP